MSTNKLVMTAGEIAESLGVSKSFAYKIVQRLNAELRSKGFYTVSGKVSRRFFEEKVYGAQFAPQQGEWSDGCLQEQKQ